MGRGEESHARGHAQSTRGHKVHIEPRKVPLFIVRAVTGNTWYVWSSDTNGTWNGTENSVYIWLCICLVNDNLGQRSTSCARGGAITGGERLGQGGEPTDPVQWCLNSTMLATAMISTNLTGIVVSCSW